MYIVAGIVLFLYIAVFILSGKTKPEEKRGGIYGIFDKMSSFLIESYEKRYGRRKIGNSLTGCLEQLTPGENSEKLRKIYVMKKLSLILMTVLLGTLIAAGVHFSSVQESNTVAGGQICREDYLGETRNIELIAKTEDFTDSVSLTLNPQLMTEEEASVLLDEFVIELEAKMLGENSGQDLVSRDLNLVKSIDGYPFKVEWSSDDMSLVSPITGEVSKVSSDTTAVISATITYEGYVWEKEFALTLVPENLSEQEETKNKVEELLREKEETDRNDITFDLPTEYEGKEITWAIDSEDISIPIFIAVLILSVIIYFMSDRDLGSKLEAKKKKMKKMYPDIVQKMVLYIGAGMTARNAFLKITGEEQCSGNQNPAVYEMMFTCRELKSGVTEDEAYERFGRRTGLQEYIRFSTLLEQNLKKGNSSLLPRLREEAENVSLERIQSCRRAGEEATTKLLLPMVLILLVIMVMIMLPAFSSINL